MSVPSSSSRAQYVGNNSTVTPYVVPFEFAADADLVVVVTDQDGVDTALINATDYTLSGAGNPSGGSFVTTLVIPATSTVTVYSEVTIDQQVVYVENADFPAKTQEGALDKLTRICQQIDRKAGAAFRLRETDGDAATATKIINSLFGLNASGDPLFRTADEVKSWLSLAAPILNYPTKTWADDPERALAVPDFVGQFGSQRDSGAYYNATGLLAGDWQLAKSQLVLGDFGTDFFTANAAGRLPFSDGWLNDAKLAADAVTTAKIADHSVTTVKLANSLDLSAKTVVMPPAQWMADAPAGTVLQVVSVSTGAPITITAIIPDDDSIPQNTEGVQVLSCSITPSSASNRILVKIHLFGAGSVGPAFTVAGFRGLNANAIMAIMNSGAGYSNYSASEFLDSPNTNSTVTYSMRAGPSGGSLYLSSYFSGAPRFAGVGYSTLTLMEIKG